MTEQAMSRAIYLKKYQVCFRRQIKIQVSFKAAWLLSHKWILFFVTPEKENNNNNNINNKTNKNDQDKLVP